MCSDYQVGINSHITKIFYFFILTKWLDKCKIYHFIELSYLLVRFFYIFMTVINLAKRCEIFQTFRIYFISRIFLEVLLDNYFSV